MTADIRSERIATIIEGGDSEAVEAENASPRPWGFDVEEINRSYALAIWGGKAIVVNEQPHGPLNDRVRVLTLEAMHSWFANRVTEIEGADGKIKVVSWAAAYIGVSPSTFDKLVADNLMPGPKKLRGRTVWDRKRLDECFDALDDGGDNPWD